MTQAGNDLKKLAQVMHERVVQEVEDHGVDARTALGRMWTQNLQEQGVVQNVHWCRLDVRGAKGVLIDGWSVQSGDTGDETSRVHLFGVIEIGTLAGQDGNDYAATVKRAAVEAMFVRMERAAAILIAGGVLAEESEDEDVAAMAQVLRGALGRPTELELVVITDGKASTSDFGHSPELGAVRRMLDIAWLQRNAQGESAYSVDLAGSGRGLPCLVADRDADGAPRILLTSIRGDILAKIYVAHRERLMERNVRSFLQTRNKVNKGILRTLQDEPERFLCFNNGISATASSVEIDPDTGNLISVEGLQIVNGGQTTATIHAFSKRARGVENLTRVQVQTKITVVPDAELSELVPRISVSSNTQTAIKGSDLQANMDWEIELERASRGMLIMGPDGTESGWFYERARGSHATMLALKPNMERLWPTAQVLTKADAALMLASWNGRPELASKGPEAGFVAITKAKDGIEKMLEAAEKKGSDFDLAAESQAMFRRIVALAMLRREVQRFVAEYSRKMRPPVVNYTMAWIGDRQGKLFDPEAICRTGRLPAALVDMARQVVPLIDDVIQNQRPPTVAHESEWPKRPACWTMVKALDLSKTPELRIVPRPPTGAVQMAEPERRLTAVERLAQLDMAQWQAARRWMTRAPVALRKEALKKLEGTIQGLERGKGRDEAFATQALALLERIIEAGFTLPRRQQAVD